MGSTDKSVASAARWTLIIGVVSSFVFLIGGLSIEVTEFGKGRFAPTDLLEIGILILLATPVMRVLVLALGYVRERDLTLALITFCILLLLSASLVIGFR